MMSERLTVKVNYILDAQNNENLIFILFFHKNENRTKITEDIKKYFKNKKSYKKQKSHIALQTDGQIDIVNYRVASEYLKHDLVHNIIYFYMLDIADHSEKVYKCVTFKN